MAVPEAGARPRVAVVDDISTMRILARVTLENAGFEVSEAGDGETGLAAQRSRWPDLVLLDVEMPGIDGFEVCRRLRSIADAARLPIMVTGHDDTQSISLAYELGATDFISSRSTGRSWCTAPVTCCAGR